MSLYAKKSLGQNFLKSKKAIDTMVAAPGFAPGDLVLEVGPGKGALTKPLLLAGARVIAFELDERMVNHLNETLGDYVSSGQLIIVHEDILEADLSTVTAGEPYVVVANIPYYITNLIIRNFLTNEHPPRYLSLLVQKEVAQRISTQDGKESILSLSVKLYGTPRYLGTVKREYFSPQPKVDSAMIGIEGISRERIPDKSFEEAYFAVVKAAFSSKRKQAIKNLQAFAPKDFWEDILVKLGLETNVRADDIPFETWLQIVDKYIKEVHSN